MSRRRSSLSHAPRLARLVFLSVGLACGFAVPLCLMAQERNLDRNAYFGETHLHTSWSVDAWVMGNRITGPDDAFKYAQGETIKHPMGFDIKIDTPLDFMGVTDHSEYVGVTKEANTPGSYVSKLPEAQPMIMKDPGSSEEQNKVFSYLLKLAGSAPVKAFMDPKVTSTVWKENVKLADENNHPGKFTAFCSYEWTSMPGQRNLHRNVFFRDCAKVPDYPFSALDSKNPTDLWNWMDGQRTAGNELFAISHNANVSDGWMYPVDVDNTTGRPIDAAWAAARDRNERLVEIKQGKVTETLDMGDYATKLSQGDRTIELSQGSFTETLDVGDHNTKLSAGNHSVKLSAGASSVEAMRK